MNIEEDGVPMSAVPWIKEIGFLNLLAAFFAAAQVKMNEFAWIMSPSRAYDFIAWAMYWCEDNNVYRADLASWLYVREQIDRRAEALRGTADDETREMHMADWENRPRVGAVKMLAKWDWWLPALRRLARKVTREIADDDVTASGQKLTPGEAVDCVFDVVDQLSKHEHFRYRTAWGWSRPLPWIEFIRGELMAWRDELAGNNEVPSSLPDDVPFSVGR